MLGQMLQLYNKRKEHGKSIQKFTTTVRLL
jgi:hypothetical protein